MVSTAASNYSFNLRLTTGSYDALTPPTTQSSSASSSTTSIGQHHHHQLVNRANKRLITTTSSHQQQNAPSSLNKNTASDSLVTTSFVSSTSSSAGAATNSKELRHERNFSYIEAIKDDFTQELENTKHTIASEKEKANTLKDHSNIINMSKHHTMSSHQSIEINNINNHNSINNNGKKAPKSATQMSKSQSQSSILNLFKNHFQSPFLIKKIRSRSKDKSSNNLNLTCPPSTLTCATETSTNLINLNSNNSNSNESKASSSLSKSYNTLAASPSIQRPPVAPTDQKLKLSSKAALNQLPPQLILKLNKSKKEAAKQKSSIEIETPETNCNSNNDNNNNNNSNKSDDNNDKKGYQIQTSIEIDVSIAFNDDESEKENKNKSSCTPIEVKSALVKSDENVLQRGKNNSIRVFPRAHVPVVTSPRQLSYLQLACLVNGYDSPVVSVAKEPYHASNENLNNSLSSSQTFQHATHTSSILINLLNPSASSMASSCSSNRNSSRDSGVRGNISCCIGNRRTPPQTATKITVNNNNNSLKRRSSANEKAYIVGSNNLSVAKLETDQSNNAFNSDSNNINNNKYAFGGGVEQKRELVLVLKDDDFDDDNNYNNKNNDKHDNKDLGFTNANKQQPTQIIGEQINEIEKEEKENNLEEPIVVSTPLMIRSSLKSANATSIESQREEENISCSISNYKKDEHLNKNNEKDEDDNDNEKVLKEGKVIEEAIKSEDSIKANEVLTSNKSKSLSQPENNTQMESEVKDGNFYLCELDKEVKILRNLCKNFEIYLEDNSLSEEVLGKIQCAIGKANLLINKKLEQFKGLCNQNLTQKKLSNVEFATLDHDLAGFWDLVYLQVDDIKSLFHELNEIKENNWTVVTKPKISTVKKAPISRLTKKSLTPVDSSTQNDQQSKSTKLDASRKRLMEMKKAARQQQLKQNTEDIFIFEGDQKKPSI